MTATRSTRLAGGLVLVALVAAGLWWAGSEPQPFYWQPGARQSYDLHSRTVVRRQPGPGGKGGYLTQSTFDIDGVLNLRVFDVGPDGARAGVQIAPVTVKRAGKREPDAEKLFGTRFYVRFSADGEMTAFDFPNSVAPEDRRTLRHAMLGLQIIVRQPGERAWQTTESDRLGTFESAYALSSTVTKEKRRYTEVSDKSGRADIHASVQIKRSVVTCTYGEPVSWLDRCDGQELVVVEGNAGRQLRIASTVSLQLRHDARAGELAIWSDALESAREIAEWRRGPAEELSLAQKRELSALESLFGDVTLPELVDELFADCKSFNGSCVNRINDFLKLHPEAAAEIPVMLLLDSLTEDQRAMLVNALQNEQTVFAQQALAQIVDGDAFPEGNRLQAMVALGDVRQPTDATLAALWRAYERDGGGRGLTKKLSDNAVLSLGRIARSTGASEQGAEIAGAIVAKLDEQLGSVEEPGRLSSVMYAAANSGDERFVEPLSALLESDNPRNRSAAAQALGVFPGEDVDATVAGRLDAEADPGVRVSIMKALGGRDVADLAVAEVCEQIAQEENDIVRGEMYRFLMRNRKRPGVRGTLQQMSALETSLENKRIISRALASRK